MRRIDKNKNSSKRVLVFHNIISELFDTMQIQVVKPELILSTDDTVNYIYKGKCKEKNAFRLVASKNIR